MKRIIPTLALSFICFVLFAEDIVMEYGSISMRELKMTTYEKDKDAEAVKIFDIGQSEFVEDQGAFSIYYKRSTRIKILDEAGLDYAEVSVLVYHSRDVVEKVSDIKAASYFLDNGKLIKTELQKKDYHIEKINEYWSEYKFVVPNAQVGSVIEYSYLFITPRVFFFKDWEFQSEIPAIYSQYTVKMIPFYEYVYILKGASGFDVYENTVPMRTYNYGSVEYKENVFKLGMRHVPAFRDESFITTPKDYIMSVDFQLAKLYFPSGGTKEIMSTWENMVDEYTKDPDFGKFISKCEKYAKKLFDIEMVRALPSKEKYEYVLDYVKSNYSWDGFYSRKSSKSVKDLVKDKRGDIAEINLFLTGLLRAVGFEAHPVFLSTRDNGKIHASYPFVDFFNYIVVFVKDGNRSYLTDGVNPYSDDRRIPEICLNDKGLLIKPGKVQWVNLYQNIVSEYKRTITLTPNNVTCKAEALVIASEYEAENLRRKIGNNADNAKTYFEEEMGAEIDSVAVIRNAKERNKPFIAAFYSELELTQVNDKIYISPFLSFAGLDNPFKQKERKLPVDLIKVTNHEFNSIIHIPEGYEIDYKPVDKVINNSVFNLEYTIHEDKDINSLIVKLVYKFKKKEYPASSYKSIKVNYDNMLQKANENIVLRKVEG